MIGARKQAFPFRNTVVFIKFRNMLAVTAKAFFVSRCLVKFDAQHDLHNDGS